MKKTLKTIVASSFITITLMVSTLAIADLGSKQFGTYDEYGRLASYPNKKQVQCPVQNKGTGVLLAFGQSNSANFAQKKVTTRYPDRVFNYFEGKCYVASSPLLGAGGEEGEWITLLADNLIANGTYNKLIVISSGMHGTPIALWKQNGSMNNMLLSTLQEARKQYKITDMVWHQGESDYGRNTSAPEYEESFLSMIRSLAANHVSAPIFIAITTKCNDPKNWSLRNRTSTGQHRLVNKKEALLGANTDVLLDENDKDECHFKESGQVKTASAYANAIYRAHK